MVTLGMPQEVEAINQELEETVTQQVAEIMEAAEVEEVQVRGTVPSMPTWKYSMPFAGVRYFSYD